jgi:ATP-dependent Clp protease ATP-binding subunit ClpA
VLFSELVNGGTVTVAVVGVGPDAKLELIAAPPRPAKPKAIAGPKVAAKKPAKADEKS